LAEGHYREEFNRIPKYEKVPIISLQKLEEKLEKILKIAKAFNGHLPLDAQDAFEEKLQNDAIISCTTSLLSWAKKEAEKQEASK